MKESQDAYALGRRIALLLLVVTLILSTLAAFSVTKSITVPIQHAVEHAERIAAGDLTKEILVTNSFRDRPIAAGHAGNEQQAVRHHPGRSRRFRSGCFRGAAGFRIVAESLAGNQ